MLDRLVGLVRRLTRPTGQLRFVECTPGIFVGLRLPPGERWQWYSLGAGIQMRMRYGTFVTPALEVLGAPGPSLVHVHPGSDVYVEFLGAVGERVWIVVSPSFPELGA